MPGGIRRSAALAVVVALLAPVLALAPPASASTATTVSFGDVRVLEPDAGSRGAFVPVYLSRPADVPVTVSFRTRAGTAAQDADYQRWGTQAAPRSITIPAGAVQSTVNVPVLADDELEGDETFDVVATGVSGGGAVLGRDAGTATVVDPDALAGGAPVLAVLGVGVVEGDAGTRLAQFSLQLSRAADSPVVVSYRLVDGSATSPDDYVSKPAGLLSVPAGQLRRTFDVRLPADEVDEPDVEFSLETAVTGGPAVEELVTTATATVLDDDVAAPNTPPTAALTATPPSGTAPLAVTLDARGSSDVDGTVVATLVDPGDGSPAVAGPVATHTYGPGTWTASVTVTDDDGETDTATATVTVSAPVDATPVSVGPTWACATFADTTARCWGRNDSRQLGDGTTSGRSTPVVASGLTGVVAVAAGEPAGSFGVSTSCALRQDLTAWCWGSNDVGTTGTGSTAFNVPTPTRVAGLDDVAEVSVGNVHACARTVGGLVRCWGWGISGRLGNGDTSNTVQRTPVPVTGLDGVVDVEAGSFHSCAVKADGTVWCWGSNSIGQLGTGDLVASAVPVQVVGLADAVQVATGYGTTCAVRRAGGVACWGGGPLGDGQTTSSRVPVAVDGLSNATQVSVGDGGVCARLADGTASCWGRNPGGSLGVGPASQVLLPTSVPGLAGVTAVSTNGQFQTTGTGPVAGARASTCFAQSVGPARVVRCVGANEFGQLGDGTTTDATTPVRVTTPPVAALSAAPTSGSAPLQVSFDTAGSGSSEGPVTTSLDFGDGSPASSAPAPVHTYASGTWTATLTVTDPDGDTATASRTITVADALAAITAGGLHTCSLRGSGVVRCWGDNSSGQLGDGTLTDRSAAVAVSGLTGAVGVSAGSTHTCAVLATGGVRCWGQGLSGRLGNGSTTSSSVPVDVVGLTDAVAVAAGDTGTCAVRSTGGVRCWGSNASGQLGNGSTSSNSPVPVDVSGITDAVAVTFGGSHACALRSGGGIRCWGLHSSGQLGTNLVAGGSPVRTPVDVLAVDDATAVVAGTDHTCALRSSGGVWCWGSNGFGQLGDGNTSNANVPAPVALLAGATVLGTGGTHTCAGAAGGTVWCWGTNADGRLGTGSPEWQLGVSRLPVQVAGLTGADGLDGGGAHTCARAGVEVRCWGSASDGQLGNGAVGSALPGTPVTGLPAAAGPVDADGCSVSAGAVRCWGSNQSGRLGNGSPVVRSLTPVQVVGLDDAVAVSVGNLSGGGTHACALRSGGGVRCWGGNASGQLGDGTTTSSPVPVDVAGISTATAVAVGASSSCALLADTTVRCWGGNANGQLGNGTTTASAAPVPVSGLAGVVSLAVGDQHACAALSDGTARCWGRATSGQVGDGGSAIRRTLPVAVVGLSDAVSVGAGESHSCARRADGSVRCWGSRAAGQLGDGRTDGASGVPVDVVNLVGAVELSVGANHSCARTGGGSVACWGVNADFRLGFPSFVLVPEPVPVAGLVATGVSAGSRSTCATTATGPRCWGWRGDGALGDGVAATYPSPVLAVGA